jgi:hypothetical protein
MPPITITERDFSVLSLAATDARDAGDMEQANALDRLARMANAALTGASYGVQLARVAGVSSGKPIRWRDMPSTLDI